MKSYFKKKKENKREQKNLRRLNEMKRIKKSIEKSNIVEYYGSELYYSTGEDQLHYSNNQVDNLTKILIKPYSITLIKSEDD